MASTAKALLKSFTGNGNVVFKNRIGFSPLTRGRADPDTAVVRDIHTVYYSERASSGFILTEATGISRQGLGWYMAPGIWTAEQVAGWKKVTEAVHAANGLIFCQLWHMGRAGHSDVFGSQPLSASDIPLEGQVTVRNHEHKPYEVPRAMTIEEIQGTVKDYVAAAKNAIEAGFDGVQLHGANGYLIDQFLQSVSNVRTDAYGGSLENRLRFLKEILEGVTAAIPAHKVFLRLSPNGAFNGMGAADNLETFDRAIEVAASFRIGLIEVMDGLGFGFHNKCEAYTLKRARAQIAKGNPDGTTALAGNVGYTQETAEKAIAEGDADFITFGRPYMSNPDLPERFRDGVELAPVPEYPDWWTKEGAEGYISFPRATKA